MSSFPDDPKEIKIFKLGWERGNDLLSRGLIPLASITGNVEPLVKYSSQGALFNIGILFRVVLEEKDFFEEFVIELAKREQKPQWDAYPLRLEFANFKIQHLDMDPRNPKWSNSLLYYEDEKAWVEFEEFLRSIAILDPSGGFWVTFSYTLNLPITVIQPRAKPKSGDTEVPRVRVHFFGVENEKWQVLVLPISEGGKTYLQAATLPVGQLLSLRIQENRRRLLNGDSCPLGGLDVDPKDLFEGIRKQHGDSGSS